MIQATIRQEKAMNAPLWDIGSATTLLQLTLWTWKYSISSNVKMMTAQIKAGTPTTRKTNNQSKRLKSHRHLLEYSNMARICTKPHLQEFAISVEHSNYKEETNRHRSMIRSPSTNAACDTWKNCTSVQAHLFHKSSANINSFTTPNNEAGK